jgi:hypothetical protein
MKTTLAMIMLALAIAGCSTKNSNDLKRSPCAPESSYSYEHSGF